jgi:hypothetical protein
MEDEHAVLYTPSQQQRWTLQSLATHKHSHMLVSEQPRRIPLVAKLIPGLNAKVAVKAATIPSIPIP